MVLFPVVPTYARQASNGALLSEGQFILSISTDIRRHLAASAAHEARLRAIHQRELTDKLLAELDSERRCPFLGNGFEELLVRGRQRRVEAHTKVT